jgi:hypothetical protein
MNSKLLLAFALVWNSLLAGRAFNAKAQMVTNGSLGGKTNTRSNVDTNAEPMQVEQALSLLAEFETSKSINQLRRAMRAMELVWYPDVDRSTDPITARRQQAKMWLQLLATIDRNLDPNFDPNDFPDNTLVPPPSGLLQLPAGADPKDIKDPVARAEYEAALKKNEEKTLRYNFQSDLRRIDLHATFDVEHFLKRFYTSAPADQKELDGLLNEAGLSASRVQKLKASLLNQ